MRFLFAVALIAGSLAAAAGGVVLANLEPRTAPRFDPLGISPEDATYLPADKRAIWEEKKRRYDEALLSPLPTAANPGGILRTVTPEVWPEGILPDGQGFINAWGAELPDRHLRVYAGRDRANPDIGVVVVRYTYKDFRASAPPGNTIIRVPDAHGPLRVVGGDSFRWVRVLGNSGRGYRLNLATSSLTLESGGNGAGPCCSLALLPAESGAPLNTIVPMDVVLGEDAGDVAAFNFKLVYDDTRLAPIAGASSNLEGNPDFNQQALGPGWSCGLPTNSGTPDIDPATGPGHGVAFLSCFKSADAPLVSTATVIATLSLRVVATGESAITIAEADFGHLNGSEIASCAPVGTFEMICAGATINGQ